MSPTRPTIRIRPRSAIADPALARSATADLPGSAFALFGLSGRALAGAVRSLGRPMQPRRVIVMPLATAPSAGYGHRR